jgi:CRP-like cAMP-binding protein
MESLNLKNHTVIFKEGAKANKLFIVKTGEILCLKSSKDRLIPVFLAKEGDIIGESAMMENFEYTYSAISISSSELMEITSFSFKQVFSQSPNWILDLTSTMISRLNNTSSLIAENRMIHPSVIEEADFTPQKENEFKKLLS